MDRRGPSLIRPLVLLAVVAVTLGAGLYLGGHPQSLPEPVRDVFVDDGASLSAEASDLIEDNFTRAVPERRLRDGSLRGMVDSLNDRFSHYFTPRENRLFRESVGGEFSGVGLTVIEHRRGLLVTGVYRRTPAARAGIEPGDVVIAVNGDSIAGQSSQLATARIKGKPGTYVTLTLRKRSPERRRTVRLRRAKIKIPVVEGRLERMGGRRVGIIAVAAFTQGVHGQLQLELERLTRRKAEAIVLDLRQNGGGLLDEAVLVSSLFIEDGVIVSTKGRKRPRRVLTAVGGAIVRQPVVVLVDRGTASASEIVTAALHERLDSKVVGRRTFGKGVFGQLFELSNGGAFDLTLGYYYTPSGRNLAGKGIRPDVQAQDDPRTRRDEALARALDVASREARSARRR